MRCLRFARGRLSGLRQPQDVDGGQPRRPVGLNSESLAFVYANRPFNNNKNYEAPIGWNAADAAFQDSWTLSDVNHAWHGEIADRKPRVCAAIDAGGSREQIGVKQRIRQADAGWRLRSNNPKKEAWPTRGQSYFDARLPRRRVLTERERARPLNQTELFSNRGAIKARVRRVRQEGLTLEPCSPYGT